MRLLLIACIIAAFGFQVAPPEKQLIYHQSKGTLTADGTEIGSGYSGKGEGKNNPDKEDKADIGPIPRGKYKIGAAKDWKGMKDVFPLTPEGHDAHGRTGFLIHGDAKQNPGNASEGCIILRAEVRKKIADSGIKVLEVVKN